MYLTKERNLRTSRTDEMNRQEGKCRWGLRPQTPGIFRFAANPSELNCHPSRRSGCFPAEPYPPLRSPVVYLDEKF